MSTENCNHNKGTFCRDGVCTLAETLKHQAEAGGDKSPEILSEGGGPYWPQKNWKSLVERTINIAENTGCGCLLGLKKLANTLTQQKKARNELVLISKRTEVN